MGESMSIGVAGAAGVEAIVDWAAAEGWNPGLSDAVAFRASDPGGFLLGTIDGEPVGAISVVRYDPTFAFLGLYIVRPEWRGRGHGLEMWRAGIALADGRTIGLDGVPEHQADYARSGFVLMRRNIRYGGVGAVRRAGGGEGPDGILPVADLDRRLLVAYDAGVFAVPRPTFLDAWLAMPGIHALAAVSDGAILGYGVARPCRIGIKIGPLFADGEAIADRLFAALAAWAGDQPLFLDVPESNVAARRLAERYAMAPVFETARMYAGEPPKEPVERIFGVTTFELG